MLRVLINRHKRASQKVVHRIKSEPHALRVHKTTTQMTTISLNRAAERTRMRDRLSRIFGYKKPKMSEQFEHNPDADLSLRTISRKQAQTLNDIEFKKEPDIHIYQKCASRLALMDTAETEALEAQLAIIKTQMSDYPLNYIWTVWEHQPNSHEHKKTASLTSKTELKSFIGSCEKSLQQSHFSIHVMKKDLKPSRSSPMLRDEMSLSISIPFGCESIWRKLLREITTEAEPLYHICGLSWTTKREKKYSLLNIWLLEKMELHTARELTALLQLRLPHFKDVIGNAMAVDNNTRQAFKLNKPHPDTAG